MRSRPAYLACALYVPTEHAGARCKQKSSAPQDRFSFLSLNIEELGYYGLLVAYETEPTTFYSGSAAKHSTPAISQDVPKDLSVLLNCDLKRYERVVARATSKVDIDEDGYTGIPTCSSRQMRLTPLANHISVSLTAYSHTSLAKPRATIHLSITGLATVPSGHGRFFSPMEITDGRKTMLEDWRTQIHEKRTLVMRWIKVNRIYYLADNTLEVLNSQDPVTGGGKYDEKETQRQGNTPARQPYGQIPDLGPGSTKLKYSLRIQKHLRTQSEDLTTTAPPIPTSRHNTQASPLELFGSYRESKIPPYQRVHKVGKVQQITDHRGTPSVSRCLGAVGNLDPAILQILLIPLHHRMVFEDYAEWCAQMEELEQVERLSQEFGV
ncbi:hypothetical protein PInf_013825 [Phytophthora infestans]|nr:hypothetical protein PInf_013825 [Phytophthora infestans]